MPILWKWNQEYKKGNKIMAKGGNSNICIVDTGYKNCFQRSVRVCTREFTDDRDMITRIYLFTEFYLQKSVSLGCVNK